MNELEIIFLGTGAGLSTTRAHTAIALRCPDGTTLLLDGSSGNSALRNGEAVGIRARDYDHVLLSHDHQDHLSGLMFVQGNRSRETPDETPLSIYGSSLALEGLRKAAVAGKVPDIRDGAAYNHSGKQVMRWQEISPGRKLELGPQTVAWSFDVDHIPGSVGWRVESGGMIVVFSGDTMYSRGLVEASQGADLLIHEALYTDAAVEMAHDRLHATSGDAARSAEQSSAKQLIITHIDNVFHEDPTPLLEDAAHTYTGPISAAYDLYRVSLEKRA